ncbi:MAG: hypothetical protein RIQ33_596 [Bacteroidota bacterium]|jgi:hypothetical protein
MNSEIQKYNQLTNEKEICDSLAQLIDKNLATAESKIWHAHPVWFLEKNPIVGYSQLKSGIRLMFWSGADFNDNKLTLGSGKFKDASITYTSYHQLNETDIINWLKKSEMIQWDYKNLVKRKGRLERLK